MSGWEAMEGAAVGKLSCWVGSEQHLGGSAAQRVGGCQGAVLPTGQLGRQPILSLDSAALPVNWC